MKTDTFESQIVEITHDVVTFEILVDEEKELFEYRIFQRSLNRYLNNFELELGQSFYIYSTVGFDYNLIQIEKYDGEFDSFKRIKQKSCENMRMICDNLNGKGFFTK
jgi:hypothetical protein